MSSYSTSLSPRGRHCCPTLQVRGSCVYTQAWVNAPNFTPLSSHSLMADFSDYISLYLDSPKYNSEPQPSAYPQPASGRPSPSYLPSNTDSQSQPQGDYASQFSSEYYTPNEPMQPTELHEAPLNQSNQQHSPSPGRRSMFDFVSPFDALNGPPQQGKRKPVPQPPPSVDSTGESSSWANITMDPKRKSVENLMDQITRGQGPPQPPAQSVTAQFDPYAPSDELPTPQAEQAQTRASRPLPPQPTQQQSPRASPPKMPAQVRPQRQSVDSPIGPPAPQGSYYQQPRKDKESSPFRPVEPQTRGKGNGGKGKNVARSVLYFLVT